MLITHLITMYVQDFQLRRKPCLSSGKSETKHLRQVSGLRPRSCFFKKTCLFCNLYRPFSYLINKIKGWCSLFTIFLSRCSYCVSKCTHFQVLSLCPLNSSLYCDNEHKCFLKIEISIFSSDFLLVPNMYICKQNTEHTYAYIIGMHEASIKNFFLL
jgi:hypothetical protein